MKTKRLGFTLMELLVVIVVLSILALLLFPVFGRVQERGREVKCASNLRQLHTATMSYISNHGGWLPHSASAKRWTRNHTSAEWTRSGWVNGWVASTPMNPGPAATMATYWWQAPVSLGTYCITNGQIFNYLGDRGDESVYVCPTMLLAARRTYPANDARTQVARSFGMNNRLSNVEYQRIDGVSRKILFADQGVANVGRARCLTNTAAAAINDPDPIVTTPGLEYFQRYGRGTDGSIEETVEYIGELHGNRPGRNTGTANAIFCDGHVERVVHTNTDSVCNGNWEYGRPAP